MPSPSDPPHDPPGPSLGELVTVFLRISLLGFGGPNAHIALMLDEVVERKGWITREHFLHLVGVTNLLPGPNSSEVAIHIGYTQRGWRGALCTGLAFLAPTFILVVLLSYLYFRFGTLPEVEGVFWGLKPAILAVILAAGWRLAKVALERGPAAEYPGEDRPAFRRRLRLRQTLLTLLAFGGVATAVLMDRWEVGAMALGGLLGWGFLRDAGRPSSPGTGLPDPGSSIAGPSSPPQDTPPSQSPPDREGETEDTRGPAGSRGGLLFLPLSFSAAPVLAGALGQLFLLTLGAGAVLFGGGYMLVALLEPFVVDAYGWLTRQEFLDGIALTQAVPGPIVTLVAFVGYSVAGVAGAAVATVGIYIPSFASVLLVAPWLERWRHQAGMAAALKGVNAVVAGAILGVGLSLVSSGVEDLWGGAVLMVALVLLVRFRAKAIWIVAGGIGAGVAHILLSA